jgi:chorismate mutase
MTEDLDTLREQIDALDREIVRLLNDRARLGLVAGQIKVQKGRPISDQDREKEVLVRIAMANEGPLPQDALLSFYRQLIETIKRLEELQKSGKAG